MNSGPLSKQIIETYEQMPTQIQHAARYVLDQPHDVALLSMREQARRAGVPPATMTRLAKHLNFGGYESMRALYAEAVREGGLDFAARADRQVARQELDGDQTLAAEMATTLSRQVGQLADPGSLSALGAAAETLAAARRIYCLGMRSSFPVIAYFHYVLSLVRDGVVLFDGLGGVGPEGLRNVASDDALLVNTVHPYTHAVVEAADYAADKGCAVVAVTDSAVSPVAERARHLILVSTESPSFFRATTPAFAAAEILASVVAGRGGSNALAALRQTEAQLQHFHVHFDPKRRRQRVG
jgi:DNA-binding MurR/RpiR family transcriptional regulator